MNELRHWIDVIRDDGPEDLLIWRHPSEDFNTHSTLLVMPGEEAIFVNGGNIEQVFSSGTYKLNTQNYPFISRIRNFFSNGESAFNCVVYYVRTATTKEIKWGTMSPIQYFDETYQELRIKGYGSYKVAVDNAGLLLTKLIGANAEYCDVNELNQYFANHFHQHISDAISIAMDSLKQALGKPIFALTSGHRSEIAEIVKAKLAPIIADYGLSMKQFVVAHLKVEAADAEMEKVIRQRMAMDVMRGATVNPAWQAQQQVDILKNVSNNPSSGGIAAAGMGFGMGLNAVEVMNGMMNGSTRTFNQTPSSVTAPDDLVEKLKRIKSMFDMGLISQSDFEQKKQDLLNTL